MSDAESQIVENCPACGLAIDVTDQQPFAEVQCPSCGRIMRARVTFNNFTLLELLGEGGMGSVFRARDNNLNREVALKILKKEAGSTEADWAKLASEARLTASINHPNVVKVFSFGEDHGQFYLAMELVEKNSLDRLMMLQNRVAEAQVLDIGIQTAEGLQAAYEHGLIHRDIKPGNILFASANLAKIVDFGLARVLDEEAQEAGEIWGTPFYVAPEKLDGRPEDLRSDIYSLGGTLFHALAGRPPFDAKTASMVVLKHIKNQPVSLQAFAPHISDETAYVINRMLHKEPDQRYSSYDELLNHLNYARHRLLERAAVQEPRKHARKAKRNGAAVAMVWAIAICLCIAVVWAASVRGQSKTRQSSVDPGVSELLADAREEVASGEFKSAANTFAKIAESAPQPQANWALAESVAASLLADDRETARANLGRLGRQGFFSFDLSDQELGRFFTDLENQDATNGNASPALDAFGLLETGLFSWSNRDVENGAKVLEEFMRANLDGGGAWMDTYRPAIRSILTDYGRYSGLHERVEASDGSDGADLLLSIDQAKQSAESGPVIVEKLDELRAQVPLR